MNIWRLIPHHEDPAKFAEWSRHNGTIAIGWGLMGDLGQYHFRNKDELKRIVNTYHDYSTSSLVNGANSLWRFHNEMQIGDLVILSAKGSRKLTMRVTGDYYFVKLGDDTSHWYEHRRKAKVMPINPDRLWQASNGVALGEGVYSTLVRCARSLTEAEVIKLTD